MFGHISYVVYYTKTDNNIRLDGLPGIRPGNKLATKKQMLTNHTVQTYAHKLRMVTPRAFMVRMIETRSWELIFSHWQVLLKGSRIGSPVPPETQKNGSPFQDLPVTENQFP